MYEHMFALGPAVCKNYFDREQASPTWARSPRSTTTCRVARTRPRASTQESVQLSFVPVSIRAAGERKLTPAPNQSSGRRITWS